jgi:hypothetical protein
MWHRKWTYFCRRFNISFTLYFHSDIWIICHSYILGLSVPNEGYSRNSSIGATLEFFCGGNTKHHTNTYFFTLYIAHQSVNVAGKLYKFVLCLCFLRLIHDNCCTIYSQSLLLNGWTYYNVTDYIFNVTSFSELSVIDCPFAFLWRLLTKQYI